VFQGRYKSVPVTGTDADAYYFRIVADYIYLIQARAGLSGGHRGPLTIYKWSGLPSYIKGNGPDWLVMERVLPSFELAQDGRRVLGSEGEHGGRRDRTRKRCRRSGAVGVSARKGSRIDGSSIWRKLARPPGARGTEPKML
jgi:hypothetical protein